MAMHTYGLKFLVLVAAALCSSAALANGQPIYKWVDAQGVVHYSDKAPAKPKQKHMTVITLATLPPVNQETVKENQAWIASINHWYQSIVAQETAQQYNQILAWQASQDQAAQSAATSNQEVSDVMPIYGRYRRFNFRHWNFNHQHSHQPAQSVVFRPSLWNTRPTSMSQQLYNTNPNIH